MALEKIVSGGQTGVDRAALDAALDFAWDCGGWCPRGRAAEDGRIPEEYPLEETPSRRYAQRTEWNVRDSDGTLILTTGRLRGGTALTRGLAARYAKPCLVIDLAHDPDVARVADWLAVSHIRVLNVAGPRESQRPGIYANAKQFMRELCAVARSA